MSSLRGRGHGSHEMRRARLMHEGRHQSEAHEARGKAGQHEQRQAQGHRTSVPHGAAGSPEGPRRVRRSEARPVHDSRPRTGRVHGPMWLIHAHHLARLRYLAALKAYHQAHRRWLATVHRRERLLRRLEHVQHLMEQRAARAAASQQTGVTFELGGEWFHQIGHRRPIPLARYRPELVRQPGHRSLTRDGGSDGYE